MTTAKQKSIRHVATKRANNPVERIKMPSTTKGGIKRRVGDRFICNVGHAHPSHRTAVVCNIKTRDKKRASNPRKMTAWTGGTSRERDPEFALSAIEKAIRRKLTKEQRKEFARYWGTAPDTDTMNIFRNRAKGDAYATVRGWNREKEQFAQALKDRINDARRLKRRASKKRIDNPRPFYIQYRKGAQWITHAIWSGAKPGALAHAKKFARQNPNLQIRVFQ